MALANGAEWDWTSVYKSDMLTELDEEEETKENEPKPPVSAACSHDHSAERAIYDLSLEDKIAKMNNHQSKGNIFFEEGQYDRALLQYKQAMVVYEYTFPEEDEEWKVIDEIRFNCNLNVAAAANELGLWSETIQNCYEALKVDSNNVKALYRRAQANRRLDNFEEAKADLVVALKLRPHDIQLRQEFSLLKSQIKAYEENSKAMAEKMLQNKSSMASSSKPRTLLGNTSDSYLGADDMDDPVMYNMENTSSFIDGVDGSDLASYLRPQEDGLSFSTKNESTESQNRESWVFGDLNRPGAFVRQRPRKAGSMDTQRNCLCCV